MSAADDLKGMQLDNGWTVIEQMSQNSNSTGGTFSQSYKVQNGKDGVVGFLKAFDFSDAFAPGANTTELIQIMTSAYNFERTILSHCQERRLSRVVVAIDSGQVQVPGYGNADGRVFYLIFEMAESDIRGQIRETNRFDATACMRVLKDVGLALWQVHHEMIAHQDVKPSNVLSFGARGFKIADFGRSSRRGHSVWYDEHPIAGDKNYAPPEQMYGYRHPDFVPRRIGCDLYMLGNLAAFLFSGANITASLFAKLDSQYHPTVWKAQYADVLPYLQNAFGSVLEELEPLIDEIVRSDVLLIVKQLCNPDLAQRGHPRGVGRSEQYSPTDEVSHPTPSTSTATIGRQLWNPASRTGFIILS